LARCVGAQNALSTIANLSTTTTQQPILLVPSKLG
jgi:hypothetical protein